MLAPELTRSVSRSRTGSHFVRGLFLAVLVIFGMLAMHGIHAGESASNQSSTADVLAMHGETAIMVAATATVDPPTTSAELCATCAGHDLTMAANCMAAVVLGLLALLPGLRIAKLPGLVRAGPQHRVLGLPLPSTPTLNFLCINRS